MHCEPLLLGIQTINSPVFDPVLQNAEMLISRAVESNDYSQGYLNQFHSPCKMPFPLPQFSVSYAILIILIFSLDCDLCCIQIPVEA